jgi:hypothetical protein
MGKGFVIGLIWGGVLAAVLLAGVSLNTSLPDRADVDGAGVPAAMPDAEMPDAVVPDTEMPDAVVPAPDAGMPQDEVAPATDAPADTIPLPQGTGLTPPPVDADAALPAPDTVPLAVRPIAPPPTDLTSAPAVDTAPAPQPDMADTPVAPQIDDLSATATLPAPDAAPVVAAPARPQLPQVPPVNAPAIDIASATQSVTQTVPAAPRLPQVGTDGTIVLDTPRFTTVGSSLLGSADVLDDAAADAARDAGPQPAIIAFAAPFDATETRPLLAIVLIDAPDSPLDLAALTGFSFPVAFAIDPLLPDAAARAAAFRAEGFEVVILASAIPTGATATDTEVALGGGFATVPEAVALLDTDTNRVQGDSPVLAAVVAVLAETGHGLVSYPRGLNVAEQSAARADVPAATLFRVLDTDRERETVITRYLSRAAFAATQEGAVIIVGHTYPDTVAALYSWALGDRSEGVAIAPLSAVLTRPRS